MPWPYRRRVEEAVLRVHHMLISPGWANISSFYFFYHLTLASAENIFTRRYEIKTILVGIRLNVLSFDFPVRNQRFDRFSMLFNFLYDCLLLTFRFVFVCIEQFKFIQWIHWFPRVIHRLYSRWKQGPVNNISIFFFLWSRVVSDDIHLEVN